MSLFGNDLAQCFRGLPEWQAQASCKVLASYAIDREVAENLFSDNARIFERAIHLSQINLWELDVLLRSTIKPNRQSKVPVALLRVSNALQSRCPLFVEVIAGHLERPPFYKAQGAANHPPTPTVWDVAGDATSKMAAIRAWEARSAEDLRQVMHDYFDPLNVDLDQSKL